MIEGPKLGRFWVDLAMTALEAEAKDRCASLEKTPLGAVLRAGLGRRKQILDEGRQVEDNDIAAFLDDLPAIVRAARGEDPKE